MAFVELLKNAGKVSELSEGPADESQIRSHVGRMERIQEEEKNPQEILRGAGFKIKLVTSTSFGTQIDFAKQYDEEKIKDILSDFSIKIKGKSVFIVD